MNARNELLRRSLIKDKQTISDILAMHDRTHAFLIALTITRGNTLATTINFPANLLQTLCPSNKSYDHHPAGNKGSKRPASFYV